MPIPSAFTPLALLPIDRLSTIGAVLRWRGWLAAPDGAGRRAGCRRGKTALRGRLAPVPRPGADPARSGIDRQRRADRRWTSPRARRGLPDASGTYSRWITDLAKAPRTRREGGTESSARGMDRARSRQSNAPSPTSQYRSQRIIPARSRRSWPVYTKCWAAAGET